MHFPVKPMDQGEASKAYEERFAAEVADAEAVREAYKMAVGRLHGALDPILVPVVRRRLFGLGARVVAACVEITALPKEGRIRVRWGRYDPKEDLACCGQSLLVTLPTLEEFTPDYAVRCAREAAKHTAQVLERFPEAGRPRGVSFAHPR